MEKVKDEGDETLYDELDSAYATDDENSEVTFSLSAMISLTPHTKKIL